MLHTLIGNLTEDPTFAVSEAGIASVRLRLAVNESYRDKRGQWQEAPPVFWDCFAWRGRADQVRAAGWRKGQALIVVGEFASSSWMSEDGEKRWRTTFTVRHVGADATRPRKIPGTNVSTTGGELPTLGAVDADAEVGL